MSGYFYRGRHRKPTHTGRNLAVVASTGALAFPVTTAFTAPAAHADILDEIERCESGGNPHAQNPSSTASGAFQFLDSTWRSVTGLGGSASDYSYAQQRAAAEKLYAQQGTTPWNPSKSCWGGSGASGVTPRKAATAAPQQATPKAKTHRAAPRTSAVGVTGKRAADGTGMYVCGPSSYYLADCDPGDDGEVKAYPPYDGHKAAPTVKRTSWKASAATAWAPAPADLHRRDHMGRGTYVCDTAHLPYSACDPDTLGQTVQYPLFDKYR